MELLKSRSNTVYLEGESGWASVTASWKLNGTDKGALTVNTVTDEPGVFSAVIPYIDGEGSVDVTWSFTVPAAGAFTRTDTYDAVTPILSNREIKAILDPGTDDTEVARVEAAVRHIINNYCGQTFGTSTGSKTAVGQDNNNLWMPERILSVDTLVPVDPNIELCGSYSITGDGWYLSAAIGEQQGDYLTEITPGLIQVNGVIYNPYSYRHGMFKKDAKYTVTGTWGYDRVPEAVREAAKLLTNDYSNLDVTYRDSYLTSLTSPDWRIEYHPGAFTRTGNVRADQLLSEYVLKRGWAVI